VTTGVAYVDGRTGEGRAAGGWRGRTDDVHRPAVGEAGRGGGTASGSRRADKPQSTVARLWLVLLNCYK